MDPTEKVYIHETRGISHKQTDTEFNNYTHSIYLNKEKKREREQIMYLN